MSTHHGPARRERTSGWLVMAMVLIVAGLWGCTTPPGGDGDADWTPLAPGGEVEGPNGVRLLAPDGVLTESVGVELRTVQLPEAELDEGLSPAGEPLSIRSQSRAATASGDMMSLLIPLPPGVDPATAGFAVYFEDGEILWHDDTDGPVALDAPFWETFEFDEVLDGSTARVEIAVIPESPIVIQIVEGAGFLDPPEVGSANQWGTSSHGGGGFMVYCRIFHQDVCTTFGADAVAAFDAAHARFSGMGFRDPLLKATPLGAYRILLRPRSTKSGNGTCKVGGRSGRYNVVFRRITICVGGNDGGNGWDAARSRVAAHELFHAVQYAYPNIRLNSLQMWSVEGTANLSEASTATTLTRDTSDPRAVDVPLDLNYIFNPNQSDSNQYRTQDFFAFLGDVIAPGQGLGYLIDIFETGLRPGRVSHAIEGFDHPEIADLSDAYWAWARNQTFEKTVRSDTRGNAADHPVGAPCALLPDVATPHTIVMLDGVSPGSYAATLRPLTSAVIEIVVDAAGPLDEELIYTTSTESGVLVALYDPNDCSNPDLRGQGLFQVPAGTSETRWLLVANTEFQEGRTRDIAFEISYGQVEPGVQIIQPAQGAVIDESQTFTLEAVAVDGELPGDALLSWTYEGFNGVPVTVATERADTPVVMPTLCDGAYTIAVEVLLGPDPFLGAADAVDVTIEDAVPRPAACAWSVEIVQPGPGAVVPIATPVTFRAEFDDDHPETDAPLGPITWSRRATLGGFLWTAFGTGAEVSQDFAPGYWDVRVQYGDAFDELNILADAGSPPSVEVTSPVDGTTYDWEDHLPGPQVTIPLEATVEDPEDGTLDGDSVVWQTRSSALSDWADYTTGASGSFLAYFNVDWVDFRVVATDSDGFETTSETIRVEFLVPGS